MPLVGGLSLGPGADRFDKIISRSVLARLDSTRRILDSRFSPPASPTRLSGSQSSEPRILQPGLCRRVLDVRKRPGLIRLLSLSCQISPQWESKMELKANPRRLGFIRTAVSRGPKLKGRTYHLVVNEVSPRPPDPRRRYKATAWCAVGFPALTLVDYGSYLVADGLKPDALVWSRNLQPNGWRKRSADVGWRIFV